MNNLTQLHKDLNIMPTYIRVHSICNEEDDLGNPKSIDEYDGDWKYVPSEYEEKFGKFIYKKIGGHTYGASEMGFSRQQMLEAIENKTVVILSKEDKQ